MRCAGTSPSPYLLNIPRAHRPLPERADPEVVLAAWDKAVAATEESQPLYMHKFGKHTAVEGYDGYVVRSRQMHSGLTVKYPEPVSASDLAFFEPTRYEPKKELLADEVFATHQLVTSNRERKPVISKIDPFMRTSRW